MSDKFKHKKSLGQHFLNSDYVPKKMCDAADVQPRDTVLEVGPGTGILTREILARGAKVIAIETDVRAIEILKKDFVGAISRGQLTICHHDARNINPLDFRLRDHDYKVVSNIPYYLSGLLFRQLLDTACQPKTLVFLIQKEVAERIARDVKESLLSLSIKVFGEPLYVSTIKRGHFTPPPKIDSAILAVTNINKDRLSPLTSTQFFRIAHLGFGQKRKQLLGSLATEFDRTIVTNILSELDLPLTTRAEDISVEKWLTLAKKLQSTL